MDVASRIRELRNRKGLTQKELANKVQVSPQVISNWERGYTVPNTNDIIRLGEALEAEGDYLLYGRTDKKTQLESIVSSIIAKSPAVPIPAELIRIPVLGTIKAGYDLYAEQLIEDYRLVDKNDVADGEYFFLRVKGDSMIEDRIMEGDRVLVRRQDFVEDGQIGVILVNGDEATLKRVFYQENNMVVLQASNRRIPPKVLPIEDVRIQGQVVKVEFDV